MAQRQSVISGVGDKKNSLVQYHGIPFHPHASKRTPGLYPGAQTRQPP